MALENQNDRMADNDVKARESIENWNGWKMDNVRVRIRITTYYTPETDAIYFE